MNVAIIFNNIKNRITYTNFGKDVIYNKFIIRITLKPITNTGKITNTIYDWHKRPLSARNW